MSKTAIPLAIPDVSGNEGRYLQACIDSGFVSSVGPYVNRFEEMVAQKSGTAYAVATNSGTSALHLALIAVGVERNDLVVVPSYTFVASANAISLCGASPWLMDVTEESWTLDPTQLRYALERNTSPSSAGPIHKASGRRVGAVMPVHTAGHPSDMNAINAVANQFGLPVVADAAAALGADYCGHSIGVTALASAFSFNGNKTVTAGGGGAVVTQDLELAKRIRHLSTTARVGRDYVHDEVGFNYRMTNLQAAVGCAQLERLDLFVSRKSEISATYERAFRKLGLTGLPQAPWARSSHWMSCVVLPANYGVTAEELVAQMRSRGVEARLFWRPMHEQAPYAQSLKQTMEVTDGFWARVVALPCSSNLSDEEQRAVIDALGESVL